MIQEPLNPQLTDKQEKATLGNSLWVTQTVNCRTRARECFHQSVTYVEKVMNTLSHPIILVYLSIFIGS